MMFMSMPEGWHKVIAASPDEKRQLLSDAEWRATARAEWDRTEKAMFPHRRLDGVRIVEVAAPEQEEWLGRSLADLVAARGGHPSDVFADFVLANDCQPGGEMYGKGWGGVKRILIGRAISALALQRWRTALAPRAAG